MSSSTSSFDAGAATAWWRFLRVYLAMLLAAGAAFIAAIVLVDPYNTGMLTPFDKTIVATHDAPRFANAGRARDPRFDSAIFGNSTAQLLEPERLDRLVGGHFANLVVPGSTAVEQLVTLQYFLRHHAGRVRTLVITMDMLWCYPDRTFARDRILHPFPFWLYDGDRLDYMAHVAVIEGMGLSMRKLKLLLGRSHPRAPADGYVNFESGRTWRIAEARQRMEATGRMLWMTDADAATIDHFAALEALDGVIAGLPEQVKVVLLFTPYFSGTLPAKGGLTARRLESCKEHTARIAGMRNAIYRDFLQDDAMTQEIANFWDAMHYRIHIARLIENEIGAALKAASAAY